MPNLLDASLSLKKVFAEIFALRVTKSVTLDSSDLKTRTRAVTKIANSELTRNAQTRIHPVVSVRNDGSRSERRNYSAKNEKN